MPSRFISCVSFLALLAAGCAEPDVQTLSAKVHVVPEEVDLGVVYLRDRPEVEIRLENRGSATANIRFDKPPFGFVVKPSVLHVAAFGEGRVTLHFLPRGEGRIDDALAFSVDKEKIRIPVRAQVYDSPFELPEVLDFGKVRMGTEAVELLPIRNRLDEPVEVKHGWGVGGSVASYTFGGQGLVLEPGEETEIPIHFKPVGEGGTRNAMLQLGCDGCPFKEIALFGKGVNVSLSFNPDPLSFGVVPGQRGEQMVEVRNVGEIPTGPLRVALTETKHFSVEPQSLGSLAPGEWTQILVTYVAPPQFGTDVTELLVLTEENLRAGKLSVVANVFGTELDVRGPSGVLAAPVSWEGGPPYSWIIEVLNQGTEPEVPLTTEIRGRDADVFELVPMDDGVLEVGNPEPFRLNFRPWREGAHEVTIIFRGDGSQATFSVDAWGNRPAATCEAIDEVVEVGTQISLRGWDASPLGDANCSWRVREAPEGSLAQPKSESDCFTEFEPKLVGDYVLEFELVDAAGNRDRCIESFSALPSQHLWVELFWDRPSDVDLYLFNNALGNPYQRNDWITEAACFFNNCKGGHTSLAWGVEERNRPVLDVDVVNGQGPENVYLEEVLPNASFSFGVHWFNRRGVNSTDATVKVHCRGQLRGVANVTLDQNKLFYRLGEIQFEGNDCRVDVDPVAWYDFSHP